MSIYGIEDLEKFLKGKKILSGRMNPEKDAIELNAGDRIVILSAYGNCCSTSWFEHLNGVDFLIGNTVTKIERVNMSHKNEGGGELKVYGYRFTTKKGHFEIEMRNSSNGYYGGSLEVSYADELDKHFTKKLKDY